jgi:hypothetical protein
MTKYNLILCELHYTPIHGKTEESDPNIEGHYLLIEKFNPHTYDILVENTDDDDLNNYYKRMLYENTRYTTAYIMILISILWNHKYKYLLKNSKMIHDNPHTIIRNYEKIISKKNYILPEIGECITLSTGETIVILKTFWIKIIQRTWKNILKKRNIMFSDPTFVIKMQMNSSYYKKIPSLKGMICL